MKKILAFVAALTLSLVAYADNNQMIKLSELPAPAQTFIRKYFHVDQVAYVEREREVLHYDYKVYLNDATEIDFDHQGHLESIDCKRTAVPAGVVPELIISFVKLHHPEEFIVEYSIDFGRRTVELNNGLELVFDTEGHFIKIDD
jgi:hypothetical protein